MKAKFVNEKFDRDKKPVGLSSDEGIDQLIKSWQDKGIKFGFMFFSGDQMDKKRDYLGKYHKYIEKYLDKLNKAGVPWEHMTLWGDHVDVKAYQITKGNWALFKCLTKEDAEAVVNVIENMVTGNQTYNISEDREHINMNDQIHMDSDSKHSDWEEAYQKVHGKRRTELDFLDNIEETRKKLKSIQ